MTARKFTPRYPAGPASVANELELPSPPELGEEIEQKGYQKYLPVVMIGAIVLLIGIMVYSGVRQFNPMFMMMPAFFIIMGIGYMTNMGSQGKTAAELDADRKQFLRYLTDLRERVARSATQQIHYWGWHAPHPDDLSGLVGGTRQWSRQSGNDLFGAARVGKGTVPADDKLLQRASLDSVPVAPQGSSSALVGPQAAPQPYLEPVTHMWLVKFIRTHGLIHDCPKVVNLRTHPTVSIGGDPDRAAGLLRAMICHLALFHAPDDVRIRVLTDNPSDPAWSWVKWLPNVHHPTADGPFGRQRLIFPNDDAHIADLTSRSPHAAAAAPPAGPYHFIVNLTGQTTYPRDGKAGVTHITLGQTRAAYQMRANADGTVEHREPQGQASARKWELIGDADYLTAGNAALIARRLAGWTTSLDQVATPERPKAKADTSWLSMVGARSVEELTPDRWQPIPDSSPDRLRLPFGHFKKTGEVAYLDIKEGSDMGNGPHGMLIGTTGSGKSEFLKTLLLSAVATHHPSQLNLLLADFKGGTTYQGMEALPHTTAVITNFEEDASMLERFDDVFLGEIVRRERAVNAAHELSGESVPDVRAYERLREAGFPLDPMPALFVVVDEFAMLMQAHPEFGDTFNKLCTVGRGLRIHFLFATQSLANVNVTKIEPNCAYRIALRTESPSDSKLVIGTPEAMYINNKDPGTGYIRFSQGEDPLEFRTVRTDLPYQAAATTTETADAAPSAPISARAVEAVRFFTGYDETSAQQETFDARHAG